MKRSFVWLGLFLVLLAGACTTDGDASPTASLPGPTSTSTATVSPSVTATSAAPSTTATTAPTSRPPLEVNGLFGEPQFAEPDAVVSLGLRESAFPAHDFASVVLYDTLLGTVRTFGAGQAGIFSSDSRYMVWLEGAAEPSEPATLQAIELASGEVADLGPVRTLFGFVDAVRVRVGAPDSVRDQLLVNVDTGERETTEPVNSFGPPERSAVYSLDRGRLEPGENRFSVRDRETNASVLVFEALGAEFSGDRELVVRVLAGEGVVNLFLVDIETGESTFVATSAAEPRTVLVVPVAANEHHVVWTPSFCNGSFYFDRGESSSTDRGPTVVYDRATGTRTALEGSTLWIAEFTPDGRMVDGGFGGEALIDPTTLSWDVMLSEGSVDVNWSPDFRYASRGTSPGHGGTCPS